MTNATGAFIWHELMTTDADAATRFYGEVVGWQVQAHSDPAAGDMDYRMIVRSDGGTTGGVFQLTSDMTSGGAVPCWLGYISVDDVDKEVAAIVAEGGALRMPAVDLPVGRFAMVTDPQGAPYYVMKPVAMDPSCGQQPNDLKACLASPQCIRWNELSTADDEQAVKFYTSHYGWSQNESMDMGDMGQYRFIERDGAAFGAIMKKPPEMPVSVWTYYIGVDDIDRAVSAISTSGGTVTFGPMEIPGGEFVLNGIDPQGAHFGLVGPRTA